jgi:molybdenum cofactor biosynthesis protein B
MREMLEAAGHAVVVAKIVKDEPAQIRALLQELAAAGTVQAVLFNGGTGISRRDTTYEAVAGLLEKRLDGFGELFRMLSYQEIGAAAMLSRAIAGTYRDLLVFCTPGSTAAVRLAMDKLIVPELSHLAWEVWRQKP